jgi:transcription elongation factor GreA
MNKQYRLTKEGIKELEQEHEVLVGKRSDIAEAIKSARELGDLAENAEYQSARQEQDRNETRIAEIEHILQNAELIKASHSSTVHLGSQVSLKSTSGAKKDFRIVGTVEADPLEGKISDESPLGQAVLGKKEGDSVEIATPAETTSYKIVSIS